MNQNPTIIDVRSPMEFNGGHVEGSINIPLNEIESRVAEIKKMNTPVILCCASGMRSSQATIYLKSIGVDCVNGGSWMNLN